MTLTHTATGPMSITETELKFIMRWADSSDAQLAREFLGGYRSTIVTAVMDDAERAQRLWPLVRSYRESGVDYSKRPSWY